MKAINLRKETIEFQRANVMRAIVDSNNNKAEAARKLGLNRTTLIEMIKRFDLGYLMEQPKKKGRIL